MDGELYFEDLSLGQVFTTGSIRITAEQIRRFAAEYDPQPQHLDEDSAAGSIFGELVASGWQTGALTLKLMLTAGGPRFAGSLGAGVEQLTWPNPVRPGDSIHAVTEVVEMRASRSRPGRGIIRLRSTTFNQRGEPVLIMTSTAIILRRPAPGG